MRVKNRRTGSNEDYPFKVTLIGRTIKNLNTVSTVRSAIVGFTIFAKNGFCFVLQHLIHNLRFRIFSHSGLRGAEHGLELLDLHIFISHTISDV